MSPPVRLADLEPDLKGAELKANREGLETSFRNTYDTLIGRFFVVGPQTRYRYGVTLPALRDIPSLRGYIGAREAHLLFLGYKHDDDWQHEIDRDDDGDRYIHDHYAVNPKTGERRQLDVSPNCPDLIHEEFRLHVMLAFPNRRDVQAKTPFGPIKFDELERLIFGMLPVPTPVD